MPNNAILSFYRREGPDAEGRMLDELLEADDEWLESVHDYIQWLFPTRRPSGFNSRAPELNDAAIEAFHSDATLREALRRSFDRMLAFYGFEWTSDGGRIAPSARWREQSRNWLHRGNHNLLRITRILDCLRTLGLKDEAEKFYDALSSIYATPEGSAAIGDESFQYWSAAGR